MRGHFSDLVYADVVPRLSLVPNLEAVILAGDSLSSELSLHHELLIFSLNHRSLRRFVERRVNSHRRLPIVVYTVEIDIVRVLGSCTARPATLFEANVVVHVLACVVLRGGLVDDGNGLVREGRRWKRCKCLLVCPLSMHKLWLRLLAALRSQDHMSRFYGLGGHYSLVVVIFCNLIYFYLLFPFSILQFLLSFYAQVTRFFVQVPSFILVHDSRCRVGAIC